MNELVRKKNITICFALITSILLPVGIPGIVLGAVFQIWVLMGISAFCVFSSFYACPLLWVSFARKKYLCSLAIKIEEDSVYSIDSLAIIFNKDIATIMNDVKELISKRYISNYLLDEEARRLVRHEKERKLVTFFCPSCGATIERNDTNKYVCEYCHSKFEYR